MMEPESAKNLVLFNYEVDLDKNHLDFETLLEIPYNGCPEEICEMIFKERKIPKVHQKGKVKPYVFI